VNEHLYTIPGRLHRVRACVEFCLLQLHVLLCCQVQPVHTSATYGLDCATNSISSATSALVQSNLTSTFTILSDTSPKLNRRYRSFLSRRHIVEARDTTRIPSASFYLPRLFQPAVELGTRTVLSRTSQALQVTKGWGLPFQNVAGLEKRFPSTAGLRVEMENTNQRLLDHRESFRPTFASTGRLRFSSGSQASSNVLHDLQRPPLHSLVGIPSR
jgi:hypothetical protein